VTTPTELVVSAASQTIQTRDNLGRTLTIRRLHALDRLRLLKLAGPELSQNDAWLNIAALAVSVTEIDGVPRAPPVTERQVETTVSELGDLGLQAAAEALSEDDDGRSLFDGPPEGNAEGTPI
jgi:hypothetical protein